MPGWSDYEEVDPVASVKELAVQPSVVLDQGRRLAEPSSVVDFTTKPAELVRQGKGEVYLESP